MSEALRTQIEENAQAPRSIETDGLRVQEHSLPDQIEAHKFLQRESNATSRKLPIRIGKFSASRPVR